MGTHISNIHIHNGEVRAEFVLRLYGEAPVCGAERAVCPDWGGNRRAGSVCSSGGSLTFLAFIGCCAAHKRWKVLLCCYWFILSALIAAQVVVGLYVVHQAKDGKIHERLSKVWHSASDGWRNEVQDNFSCCGFEDPSDDPGTVCPGHTKLNPDAGCFPVLKHDAKRVLHTVVIAALVLAGIEVFCLLASMCLLCCLNTKRVDPANQGLLNTPAPRSAYRATYSSRPYTEA